MKNIALITAGGSGQRMGRPKPRHLRRRGKQFLKLNGRPMLAWTLAACQKCPDIDGIILVVSPDQIKLAKRLDQKKVIAIVAGGRERPDSVRHGLDWLPDSAEIVAIHDGARPAITPALLTASIKGARKHGAVVVGVPVKDTIKRVTRYELRVTKTVDRSDLWQAQTPQAFQVKIIKKAYAKPAGRATDDAMLVEKSGIKVKMVMGSYENLKVTTPEDLKIMSAILAGRSK
ncbi:MAG: 2-C-methyl-D-erythritol 4-phosphate cytidylyltransferase [Candidatus Margulisiibacteriota bacterium]